jgi:hypothetical protein
MEHQYRALSNLIHRKDVFGILPTGYEKSLIFQSSSTESSRTTWQKPQFPGETICKLNFFIDSHVHELRKRGFRVTSLSNEEDEKAILDGECREFTFLLLVIPIQPC